MKQKKKLFKVYLISFLFVIGTFNVVHANTYIVTRSEDDTRTNKYEGTLRWAIVQANSNPGLDVIQFNIGITGNSFENDGSGNSWAVITVGQALPIISDAVIIDGTTQANTNTGMIIGKTVGVIPYNQGNINFPDIYIVCGYTLPSDDNGFLGNGLSINSPNVTIKGLAISGFGNRSNEQPKGIAHGDISVLHASSARTMNLLISDCFISCDPRGNYPPTASGRSMGSGIVVLANNNHGNINRNYVAHCGGYGIVFHANQNNTSATPNIAPSSNWVIEENQIINIGRSTTYSSAGRAADGISLMTTNNCIVRNNYVVDWEQFGIDLGHNTDDNIVDNNTVTGFTKTIGAAPCGGIRTGFSSERNVIIRNKIYNNTSTKSLAGIWSDETVTGLPGGNTKNSFGFIFSENEIHNNVGSGIALSTNGDGSLNGVRITKNSIYYNSGLGIDLGFSNLNGNTLVTMNDDGDVDGGTNYQQNFPVIESVGYTSGTFLTIWGKAPAGSIIEFFVTDGEINNHGGLGLSYGEGRTFIGTAVEGSADDGATGTGSYNIDGNVANNNVNNFRFTFNYPGLTTTDLVTATATINNNTSEFGPRIFISTILGCNLLQFSGNSAMDNLSFRWKAICDDNFSHFIIEESKDAVSFSTLKVVNEIYYNKEESYKADFKKTIFGNNFYRIKMVLKNGGVKYSNVIRLTGSNIPNTTITISPNPVQNHFSVNINLESGSDVRIIISNATGKIVDQETYKGFKGTNTFMINSLNNLPAGIYLVDIISNEQKTSKKIYKR